MKLKVSIKACGVENFPFEQTRLSWLCGRVFAVEKDFANIPKKIPFALLTQEL
jgi:hypothetical protein